MRNKTEIKIKPFWYSDIWIFPKLITIITTLDKEGKVNAAPYSHIMQYDVMHKNPRMMLGFRNESHTFQNISDTGEFVINCPSADYLDDMMETARFWPAGVNELEHTSFTPIPSIKVKPPSIDECPQIMECTVDEIKVLHKSSGIVFAKIETIRVDEGLEKMDRGERIPAMNLPIGLGDQNRRYYYHCHIGEVTMHELMEPPGGQRGGEIRTTLDWDEEALRALMAVPVGVRKMVTEQVENFAREKGDERVTNARFTEMSEEYGMDADFMDRFRTRGERK